MILRDLAVICFIRFQCTGWRRYFVGLIGLGAVMLRTVNIKNHAEIGSWEYAATLNFAFIMQLLVAGGAGDGMGAWLDHRIGRLFPRFAGLLRNVVG